MSSWPKVVVPVLLVASGVAVAALMISYREPPQPREVDPVLPLVRVAEVRLERLRLTVHSQGTVSPRTESTLVPEVAGRVVEVSPAFAAGGFFERGDLLLRIDPVDYEEAVIRARAEVARAELRLEQERAEAEVARREWSELGTGDPSPLTLRAPQLAEAEAAAGAARAALSQADRNLERTRIRAPYAGRVRDTRVGVGQYVAPGSPLGSIYAVDYAEVRLPLPDSDLAFLDLPLDYRGAGATRPGPAVTLSADFGGSEHAWQGRIVRTEGEIDPKSRMIHAVARVDDPYRRTGDPERPPLAVGMYVDAEILGRELEGAAVLPRAALREGDRVLVVDAEDRLRAREVRLVRRDGERIVIAEGLSDGERVCVSSLEAYTDGMRVRVAG